MTTPGYRQCLNYVTMCSSVKLANEKLTVPITCKIRVFPEIEKTIKYAKMLEKAGCQVRSCHYVSTSAFSKKGNVIFG